MARRVSGAAHRIDRARTADDLRAVADLFREYHAWLGEIVCSQRLAEEIESLPGPYAEPDGALLLARDADGNALGCIGIRPHHEDSCEIKRLYVSPPARGLGVGRALAERAVDAARDVGYGRVLMTSVAERMDSAIRMYHAMGFRETEPFYDHSHVSEGVRIVFLARDL